MEYCRKSYINDIRIYKIFQFRNDKINRSTLSFPTASKNLRTRTQTHIYIKFLLEQLHIIRESQSEIVNSKRQNLNSLETRELIN